MFPWRRFGKSNLHQCVQTTSRNQLSKVKDLLEWGADPNIPFGPTSMTALHMSASWEKPDITEALLKAGGNPTAMDVNGTHLPTTHTHTRSKHTTGTLAFAPGLLSCCTLVRGLVYSTYRTEVHTRIVLCELRAHVVTHVC